MPALLTGSGYLASNSAILIAETRIMPM